MLDLRSRGCWFEELTGATVCKDQQQQMTLAGKELAGKELNNDIGSKYQIKYADSFAVNEKVDWV